MHCHCHKGVYAVTAARWHSRLCKERVQSKIGPWRLAFTPRFAASAAAAITSVAVAAAARG